MLGRITLRTAAEDHGARAPLQRSDADQEEYGSRVRDPKRRRFTYARLTVVSPRFHLVQFN